MHGCKLELYYTTRWLGVIGAVLTSMVLRVCVFLGCV